MSQTGSSFTIASHFQLQGYERDWTILVATSCSLTLQLLIGGNPKPSAGKTSPVCCQVTADGILEPSSKGWRNSGMGSPTEFWTLNTVEHMSTSGQFPSEGVVCSLSDVLETGDVPLRYYLTAKACKGILRRAEKRGKVLPPMLAEALLAVTRAAE
jgi:hypothetical protein